MPVITLVLFFVFLFLLLMLMGTLRKNKKLRSVERYGQAQFEIDLPDGVQVPAGLPSFVGLSDAEGFYHVITPYIGSLTKHKRDFLFQYLNDLKNELKVNKSVYQKFVTEYELYKGLSDKAAAEKWAGK